jgi:hypothetical protein
VVDLPPLAKSRKEREREMACSFYGIYSFLAKRAKPRKAAGISRTKSFVMLFAVMMRLVVWE